MYDAVQPFLPIDGPYMIGPHVLLADVAVQNVNDHASILSRYYVALTQTVAFAIIIPVAFR